MHTSDEYDICTKPIEWAEYVWVHWLLNSKVSDDQQARLHRDDIWSTWFGVPYYQDCEKPRLHAYPRLQYLLRGRSTASLDDVSSRQYPSLVSFFGDTGGGKSTLIRALIRNAAPGANFYQTPIPGNDLDRAKSTSGDVHLYSDPSTIGTETPIFYAGKQRTEEKPL